MTKFDFRFTSSQIFLQSSIFSTLNCTLLNHARYIFFSLSLPSFNWCSFYFENV